MQHIFISYFREDSVAVDRLAALFATIGIKCWIDRNEIEVGSNWKTSISNAISNGDKYMAVFSAQYYKRGTSHFYEELNCAIEEVRRRPENSAWFLPVILDNVEIPSIEIRPGLNLKDLQSVSLTPNWDDGVAKLLARFGVNSNTLIKGVEPIPLRDIPCQVHLHCAPGIEFGGVLLLREQPKGQDWTEGITIPYPNDLQFIVQPGIRRLCVNKKYFIWAGRNSRTYNEQFSNILEVALRPGMVHHIEIGPDRWKKGVFWLKYLDSIYLRVRTG